MSVYSDGRPIRNITVQEISAQQAALQGLRQGGINIDKIDVTYADQVTTYQNNSLRTLRALL